MRRWLSCCYTDMKYYIVERLTPRGWEPLEGKEPTTDSAKARELVLLYGKSDKYRVIVAEALAEPIRKWAA